MRYEIYPCFEVSRPFFPLTYCSWLQYQGLGIYNTPQLPTGMERFGHMIIYVVMDEVVFFYGHWWLHANKSPWFNYKIVHKIHHEFTSPIALTASYCHPVEMLISNVLPLCGGMFCCGSHLFTGMAWAAFAVLGNPHLISSSPHPHLILAQSSRHPHPIFLTGTQTHHCGYRWPWTPGFDHQPDFHDFHHKKFNTNYGLTGKSSSPTPQNPHPILTSSSPHPHPILTSPSPHAHLILTSPSLTLASSCAQAGATRCTARTGCGRR